jgi:NAD+ kinase
MRRVLFVIKESTYHRYVERGDEPRAQVLLDQDDPTVRRMLPSHLDHMRTLKEVHDACAALSIDGVFHDSATPLPPLDSFELVVTVGGDGTLLSASHAIGANRRLLGINSAPSHSVGFFCGARSGHVQQALDAALGLSLAPTLLARMLVLNGDEVVAKRVLNEVLFCHASPAATSRYILAVDRTVNPVDEEQKSSGIWIGPAAGSTAAQRSAGGDILRTDSTDLQFVVREPYAPLGEEIALPKGLVHEGETLVLHNKMRQAKLFIDGEHTVVDVGLGDVVRLRVSDEPLTVLGIGRR